MGLHHHTAQRAGVGERRCHNTLVLFTWLKEKGNLLLHKSTDWAVDLWKEAVDRELFHHIIAIGSIIVWLSLGTWKISTFMKAYCLESIKEISSPFWSHSDFLRGLKIVPPQCWPHPDSPHDLVLEKSRWSLIPKNWWLRLTLVQALPRWPLIHFFFNIYYADKPKYICINLTYKIKVRKSPANTVVQKNGQSEQLYGNLHASKSKEWN